MQEKIRKEKGLEGKNKTSLWKGSKNGKKK